MLDVRIVDGRQLLALLQDGSGFRALSLMSSAQLPRAAQDAFAVTSDFVRACVDVLGDTSQTDKLGIM